MKRIEQWPILYRTFDVEFLPPPGGDTDERKKADDEDELIRFTASSETPVQRWFGNEVLSHARGAVVTDYLKRNAALLVNHDWSQQVGAVKEFGFEEKALQVGVKFSRSAYAQEIKQDVEDKIRTQVSLGYRVLDAKRTREPNPEKGDPGEVVVKRWMPYEVSIVGAAADILGTGFSRGLADGEGQPRYPVEIEDGEAVAEGVVQMEKTKEELAAEAAARSAANAAAAAAGGEGDGGGTGARSITVESADPSRNAEAAKIMRLASRYNVTQERTAEFVESGMSVEQVARILLDETATRGAVAPAREVAVELPKKDKARYSYRRALLMATERAEGKGRFDGLEAEVHSEIASHIPQNYKVRGDIFLPMALYTPEERYERALLHARMLGVDKLMTRAWPLDSGTSTEGAEFKFTQPGEFIELLRTKILAVAMGARLLSGLNGPVGMPRQTAGATATWLAEEATLGSDTMAAFDTVTLTPRTLMANTGVTKQLLIQASHDIESIIREDLAAVHARAIDKAVLHGSGAPQPTGIYAASGVNSVAFGGTVTYAKIVDMMNAVAVANADLGALGWLATPGVASKAMQLLEITGVSPKIWTGGYNNGVVGGYPARVTNQLNSNMGAGTNEHGIIFGNWAEVLIGSWNVFEVLVDPYTSKKKGVIELTSFQMADSVLRHGASMTKGTGLIP